MANRVVITGMGAISPLGLSVAESWGNVVKGVSGVGPITLFDASDLLVQIACEVRGFEPEQRINFKESRRRDRFEQFATVAAYDAITDSGLEMTAEDPARVAVIISSATGGLATLEQAVETADNEGPRRLSPFMIPMFMANGASGAIAIDVGAKGPSFSVASACASGADGIGQAWTLIRSGVIDVALTGGAEATVTRVGVAAFDRLGALSRRNEDYSMTPQPFDRERDGLVMGEGAGVLVIESLDHAKKRGAEILCELVGYSATADAFHITAPQEQGEGGAAAIRQVLHIAGLNVEDVSYINAHGTGTELNDLSETRAIKTALGDCAYGVPISSTKSMTGHMMGATGALEAIFCAMAIQDGVVPPTIHLNTPDPECDLDYVPNEARDQPVEVALSNAFGFGGHNAVLALKAFSG